MKKVTRILAMTCMVGALALASSCKKKQDNNSSASVMIPQMSQVVVEGDRAYIDEDFLFSWHGDDEIMVYNLSSDYEQSVMSVFHNVAGAGHPDPFAVFQGEDVGAPMEYEYRYFYPVGMVSQNPVELSDENRQTFTVSPDQYYMMYEGADPVCMVDPDAMPMSINTDNLHQYAKLKQMFGIANFVFKAKANHFIYIESVTITDNFWNLTGDLTVKLHEVDTVQLQQLWNEYAGDVTADPFFTHFQTYAIETLGYDPAPTGKSITLHCMHPDPENPSVAIPQMIGQTPQLTQFNFILRPLALSEGFTLTFEGYTVENGVEEPFVKVYDRWRNPNLAYAMKPAVYKTWMPTTALTMQEMHR